MLGFSVLNIHAPKGSASVSLLLCVCVHRSSFSAVILQQSWQSVCVSCPHRSAEEQLHLT